MSARWPALPRPDGLTLAIAAIALLGAGLVLAREATYGVALTWESINYVGAARELLTAGDFARALEDREPLAVWPPLYPMLLAAGSFGVFDPRDVAGPLGAVVFALTILAAGCWMRSAVASRALVILGCLAIAVAFPLARLAGFAMTDALCILFFLLTLTRIDAFRNGGGRTALTWAAVFTAMACMTRYTGVALLFVVVPLLILRDGPRRERARDAAVYLVVALLPLGLWMARNALLVGGPVGDRDARIPGETLPALAGRVFQTLESWLYPGFEAARIERLMNAGTAAVLLALAVLVVAYAIRRGGPTGERRERSFVLVNGTFVLVYVPFLIISALLSSVDPNHQRQLLPVLPSLLLLAVFAVGRVPYRVRERGGARRALPLAALMALGLCLWLSLAALRNVHDIAEANGEGVPRSFTTARWRDSETVRYVRDHRIGIGSRLISDAALHLYGHTVSLDTHQDARYYHQWLKLDLVRHWAEGADGGAYVVRLRWYGQEPYVIEDLLAVPGLELVAHLSDGAIFRATERTETDPGAVAAAVARSRQARYEAAVSGELLASGHFDVHRHGRGLAYVRTPCAEADMDAPVFLRVFPEDPDDLPAGRGRHGFADLGFHLRERGVRFDGICLATIDLPAYGIAHVETGQFNNTGESWRAEFPFPDG